MFGPLICTHCMQLTSPVATGPDPPERAPTPQRQGVPDLPAPVQRHPGDAQQQGARQGGALGCIYRPVQLSAMSMCHLKCCGQ